MTPSPSCPPRLRGARAALLLAACAGPLLPLGLGLGPGAPAARAADAPPAVQFPVASPAAHAKERFGVTDVEVDYSRPSRKGREIFGHLVPYGEVWRTGANASTKISFGTDVRFGGQPVPAGRYALYTVPGPTEWTVILYKDTSLWGAYDYDKKNDLLRVTAKPLPLPTPVESFLITLDDLTENSAQLLLVWDKTVVPVKLEADTVPQVTREVEQAAAAAPAGSLPNQFYAGAASFYLEHGLDLQKALGWAGQVVEKNPKAYGAALLKAKIQVKLADKPGAQATVDKAMQTAQADPKTDPEVISTLQSFAATLR